MSTGTPKNARASVSETRAADQGTGSRSRSLVLTGVLLLAAGAALAWWWLRPPRVEPPLPADIEDREVREAIEEARRQVLDDPRSAFLWGHLGKVLLAHLFDGDADFCFREAGRLDPTDPLWPYARGLIAQKRRPREALDLLRQAAALGDSRSENRSAFRLQLAEALLERGDVDEAEKLFRDEERIDPMNARAALGLGLSAVERGKYAEAVQFLMTARASAFARKLATVQLAAVSRLAGERESAASYEKENAELAPDPPWPDPLLDELERLKVGRKARAKQVTLLERQHRYGEAAEIYLQEIEHNPTAADYIGAGINLARLREYERALPLLREGLRLDRDDAHAHYSLALALFTRAELALDEAPNSPQIKDWLREAIEHARRATELRADHASAYLFWGLALKHLGEPAAAEAPLRKGVACAPADFDLQLGLGEVLLELQKSQEAEMHLEYARRINPNDPRPAKALERLGAGKK